MIYFAYGSNLMRARLRERTPRARPIGIAHLTGHVVRFHKKGEDGSGKCDAYFTGNPEDIVYGLLYQMDLADKRILDDIEGPGYTVKHSMVARPGSPRPESVHTFFYVAESGSIDPVVKPYHWYRDLVLAGALENGFPERYVADILTIDSRPDSDSERHQRHVDVLATSSVLKSHRDLFPHTSST